MRVLPTAPRLGLRVLGCLAGGMSVTVVVAWLGAVDTTVIACGGPIIRGMAESLPSQEGDMTLVERTQTPGFVRLSSGYTDRRMLEFALEADVDLESRIVDYRDILEPRELAFFDIAAEGVDFTSGSTAPLVVDVRGWPFLALWGADRGQVPADGTRRVAAMSIGPGRDLLPLRPVWPGFVFDTAIYAVALWLLVLARRAIRNRLSPLERVALVLLAILVMPGSTATMSTLMGWTFGPDPNLAGHAHVVGLPTPWLAVGHNWRASEGIDDLRVAVVSPIRLAADAGVAGLLLWLVAAAWQRRRRRLLTIAAVTILLLAISILVWSSVGLRTIELPEVLTPGYRFDGARLAPLLFPLYLLVLARSLWRARHGPPPEDHCPRCGYPLAGLPGQRCPECGAPW